MLKYVETAVVMAEVPDEISLAINISGCPHRCPDCHSKYLQTNMGKLLDDSTLMHLINVNKGITCVVFMGGDNDHYSIFKLAKVVRDKFPQLKVAWYSGNDELPKDWGWLFDYIKIGPFDKKMGPLSSPSTNQRMYKVTSRIYTPGPQQCYMYDDITHRFRK